MRPSAAAAWLLLSMPATVLAVMKTSPRHSAGTRPYGCGADTEKPTAPLLLFAIPVLLLLLPAVVPLLLLLEVLVLLTLLL
jgi:hypothetical protein